MNDIRRATLDDITLIHDMAEIVFPVTYGDILTQSQVDYMMEWMYSHDNLRRQMTEEGHVYHLVYCDGEPAGYVSVQPEDTDIFHLQKIYVLPRFQGKHLGRLLFDCAVEYIKSIHPTPCELRLNVNRNNKALYFYEHLGMRKVAEGDFPIGNGYYMNDYIMGISL